MNRYAIYHQPESRFAYAKSGNELVIILRVAADDEFDRVDILYNNKYDFTKRRSETTMTRCAEDGIFAYYRAQIKLSDVRFAYIFRIAEGGKIYYFSEEGVSEDYCFNLAYYTFFQFPFINSADVMPVVEWTKSALFYQIFVDRFARGNSEKDESYINTPWDGDINRYSFTGGDLDGIRQKLPYLHGLGINALYLTPVFVSKTNHKYNITDYMNIDPSFGGNESLEKLLCAAHERGMKIIVDCVFNHCDSAHPYFADVVKRGRASKYYEWFMIDGDKPDTKAGNYAYFADCKYMPKWNTNNTEAREYLVNIALSYLGKGFDGLRLDVADEISHEMWRELRREVKKKYPQALILGEIWHDNEHWLKGDQLDGVMNYKLQKILVDYFGESGVSAREAADRMNRLLMANTVQANAMALNFLDNHDTPRFLRFAGGNKDRQLCALCAAVMFPGIPCVFYGTELPLDGAGDPDCRKPFDWTFKGQSKDYKAAFEAILGLKKQAVLTGTDAQVCEENGLLKITRVAGGETVTAYFNTGEKAVAPNTDGKRLFCHNCKDDEILQNGVAVVANKL